MRAILVKEPGTAEELVMRDFPTPEPGSDELLVRVKATALNRADILQREGRYSPPQGASPILGLEMAGIVEQVGPKCSGWHKGDRVCALLPGGGYAQYVTVPARMAIPVPENFSFEDAAAIPEVFLTAYQALFWLGKLKRDEHVLIHAGASGVGTAAIQLVRNSGSMAIVTAGSDEKLQFCRDLGASVAINYRNEEFPEKVLDTTNGLGVNLILDCVGASYWEKNMESIAVDGRVVLIATMGGAKIDDFDLLNILRKRIHLLGTTLRARSREYKIDLTSAFVRNILPGFADGLYKPVVDSVYNWTEVRNAHIYMEENKNKGKIVLTVD
ncbi:MAG: NAD(P)H-quinone oxidoreductase [Calditrichia bacterium]